MTQTITPAASSGEHQAGLLTPAQIVASSISAEPVKCGIYFLIREGRIVYVGQAIHIAARIAVHAQTKRFDRWSWVACEAGSLSAVERAYLNVLLPEDNMDLTTRRLRGDFAIEVKPISVDPWPPLTAEQWAACQPTEEERQEEATRRKEWKRRMDGYRGYATSPEPATPST